MEKYKEGWQGFLELCLATENPKKLSTLFDLMLTPEEKENLAMRYLIVQELLSQKKTQRDIAADLHVSIAKITRGSNEIKRMDAEFIEYLKKLLY